MTTKLFSELGLSPEIQKAIDRLGFEQASPIQAEAIPVLLSGKDVVGQSQTGSGKTAAFAIPAIEKLDPQNKSVQVLILAPTRELAVQVSEEIHKLCFFKRGIHVLPIYGGQSYERQFYGLKQGAQIVIGTPGRLMDHMRRGTLRLDAVRMAILDEADVMLDMGFREDIEFILQAVPATRQTVFFSATMPKPIQDLIRKYANDPQTVRIEQKGLTVPTVEQVYYEVDRRFKVELLTRLIDIHDLKLGIVFCNTKRMVDDLVDHLNAQGYSADRLHGDMSQGMRDRVMQKFRKSGLEFLVATDVAARGIDVDDVQVVFNYDLPYDVEDYVHRIGRTGRAGRSGRAVSFVSGREVFQIHHIERFTRTRIHRAKIPTVSEVEEARASAFLEKVRVTLQSGEFKKQDHLVALLLEEGFNSTDIASALIHLVQEASNPPAPAATDDFQGQFSDRRNPREDRRDRGREPRESRETREPRQPREFKPAREPRAANDLRGQISTKRKVVLQPAGGAKFTPASPKAPPAPATSPTTASPVATEAGPMESEVGSPPAISAVKPAKSTPSATPVAPRPRSTPQEPPRPAKVSRRTPEHQTRIHLNIGENLGLKKADLLRLIQGETGLPANLVGTIDMRERHSFIDIASEQANAVATKLSRAECNGIRVKAKLIKKNAEEDDAI